MAERLWRRCWPAVLVALLVGTSGLASHAGDLDDGISHYTDDPISKYDTIGRADKNIEFIIMEARSKAAAARSQNDGDVVQGNDTTGNINSVVVRPGSNVYGDIIIIDQSLGDKSLVIGAGVLSQAVAETGDITWP